MENIIVLEIGDQTTVVTRFCAESCNRFTTHEQKRISHPPGVSVLGSIMAGLAAIGDGLELKRCYALIPSFLQREDFSEVLGEVEDGLKARQEQLRQSGIALPEALHLMDRQYAFRNICDMVRREVGNVLLIEMGIRAVTVAGNPSGEFAMTEYLISPEDVGFDLESAAGIAIAAEKRVKAVAGALENHFAQIGHAPVQVDWIIAAGEPIVELPNELQALENELRHLIQRAPAGIPILIERLGIIPAIGAIAPEYQAGSWSLLMESLSVDS